MEITFLYIIKYRNKIKANMCRDPEEVLLYMEENRLGTEYSMLYENLANIYENEGNYEKAEVFLQNGLTEWYQTFLSVANSLVFFRRAKPSETMINLMKEFENRMRDRLEFEFYTKGLTMNEDKSKQSVPVKAGKRLCPYAENNSLEDNKYEMKRFKVKYKN
jgi:hypothetical protein